MSLYHGEAIMQIERRREDCYDFFNLQAAGEQLPQSFFEMKDKFDTGQ